MKHFILSLLLAAAAFVHANQESPVQPSPHVTEQGAFLLKPGKLPEVVRQVEESSPAVQKANDLEWQMPNIIYGPGTADLSIPTPLRLKNVSAVQALALVAAAAGCSLESIVAPAEEAFGGIGGAPPAPASEPGPIIGYRFSLSPASPYGPSISEPAPSQQPAQSSRGLGEDVLLEESGAQNKVTSLGAPATAPEFRIVKRPNPQSPVTSNPLASRLQPSPDEKLTVVYSVGQIFGPIPQTDKEREMWAAKRVEFESLVFKALATAEVSPDIAALSFHDASNVLIAKGTAEQHQIIAQILTAMKENEMESRSNLRR